MTPLFQLIEQIESHNLEVRVYANNGYTFGFGLYRPGTKDQLGWAAFDCSFGLALFHGGAVGVQTFMAQSGNNHEMQNNFAKALTNLMSVH